MFRHEGPSRSLKTNALVAGYLAFIAGFVNSGGFIMIGSFTSHVTGSVGRISTDFAAGEPGAAVLAILLVVMFFAGAFGATLLIEGHEPHRVSRAYGRALLVEAGLLGFFVFVAGLSQAVHPRLQDAEAAILCLAMGLQNSLVTRLSGAVIRTTHLTGVMTDLAIESARWYRWHRAKLSVVPVLLGGGSKAERPQPARALLLGTIVVMFVSGAIIGAMLTMRTSRWAMVFPALAVAAAAAIGLLQKQQAPPPPVQVIDKDAETTQG